MPPYLGVGPSRVNPRFHPNHVGWNLRLRRKISTPADILSSRLHQMSAHSHVHTTFCPINIEQNVVWTCEVPVVASHHVPAAPERRLHPPRTCVFESYIQRWLGDNRNCLGISANSVSIWGLFCVAISTKISHNPASACWNSAGFFFSNKLMASIPQFMPIL